MREKKLLSATLIFIINMPLLSVRGLADVVLYASKFIQEDCSRELVQNQEKKELCIIDF